MSSSTGGNVALHALKSYFKDFTALRACSREFWVVQLVNLLDGVAYFAMLTVSTLYLSETLGYSDENAAYIWAGCMLVYTAVGFVAGFIGDSLGIRRTLHISIVLLVLSRVAISLTTAKVVVLPALVVISIGTAIMTPILISATKRYTTKQTQTAGFNLLYFLMNIGAFVGNATLDPLRHLPWGNRTIFMFGSTMSILCWVAILLLWHRNLPGGNDASGRGADAAEAPAAEEKWEAPWTIALSVFRESAFWRFMLFLIILVGVKLVFEHQSQVYPKYYQRTLATFLFSAGGASDTAELDRNRLPAAIAAAFEQAGYVLSGDLRVAMRDQGVRWELTNQNRTYYLRQDEGILNVYDSEAPIGKLNSINPFIVCFGVILTTPLVARFRLFNVMFVGILFSAFSMLFLAVDPRWFSVALGWSLPQGYLLLAMLQIGFFSIGEMIWSPRLYEYTAAVAPAGREASYMGLSYVPMFVARFAEGPLAAKLLTWYCPPDITQRLDVVPYRESPQFMNLVLAIIAISTPVLILLFRGVIQKEGRAREL